MPPEGWQIDDMHIPGGMIISVPTFTIQRDERFFHKAREFYPKRWESISTESVPFVPFLEVCVYMLHFISFLCFAFFIFIFIFYFEGKWSNAFIEFRLV